MTLTKNSASPIHVAVFPTSGMGHLMPFLRIASVLLSRGCRVTLITAVPTVSAAESAHITYFLSQHPEVSHAKLQTLPIVPEDGAAADPFFLQWEATRRAAVAHLRPLLESCEPPLSALFADLALLSAQAPAAAQIRLPCYIIGVTTVRFLCVAAQVPGGFGTGPTVDIPGLGPVQASSLPPLFKTPNHLFTQTLIDNVKALLSGETIKGIIVNTFDWLESRTATRVPPSLPKIISIGILDELITEPSSKKEVEAMEKYMKWLDGQPPNSVVYLSFGSRTAMSREQIIELSKGLEKSGQRFLWVVKTTKVDKDEERLGEGIEELLGELFLSRNKERGLVLKGWARQREILSHGSVGLFVSHCGWNSVTESAKIGVPILAWPQHGDQMLAAEVVEQTGLGVWPVNWGSEKLVDATEIGERIKKALEDDKMREMAEEIGREAEKAVAPGGTSDKATTELLEFLRGTH